MEELENEYLFITRLSTHILKIPMEFLDKSEEEFRYQWEKQTYINDAKLQKLPTGKVASDWVSRIRIQRPEENENKQMYLSAENETINKSG